MPSIYRMVVHGLSLALEFYFIDIQVTGREVVPEEGPIVLAANHPNSIMDTLVLATQTRRKIRYLARSGLFKNPVMSAVFHYFGAIPVYRAQDDPTSTAKNDSMFTEAWNVLDRGGCVGIFPEGQNSEERRILKIRTGVARIALGAEARRDYQLGVRVVPVGLNFEDRDRFMSSVLVSFGKPIDVSEFVELHREDERAAVRALTERVGEAITAEALHIEDERLDDLIRDIHGIYGQHLLKTWFVEDGRDRGLIKRFFDAVQSVPGQRPDMGQHFWVKRQIVEVMGWFQEHEPEVVAQVRTDVLRYKRHLEHARLRHELLERSPATLSLRRTALFCGGSGRWVARWCGRRWWRSRSRCWGSSRCATASGWGGTTIASWCGRCSAPTGSS